MELNLVGIFGHFEFEIVFPDLAPLAHHLIHLLHLLPILHPLLHHFLHLVISQFLLAFKDILKHRSLVIHHLLLGINLFSDSFI